LVSLCVPSHFLVSCRHFKNIDGEGKDARVNKAVGGWSPYRHFEYVVGDVEPSYMMAMRLNDGSKAKGGGETKAGANGSKVGAKAKGKGKGKGRGRGQVAKQAKDGRQGQQERQERELAWLRLGEKSAPWTREDGTKLTTKHGRSRRPADMTDDVAEWVEAVCKENMQLLKSGSRPTL
jgi:hypothetical protein